MIILTILEAIVGWFILMLIGTNLVGFFSAGLIRKNIGLSFFVTALGLLYLVLLLKFLNIGVVIAATMLMVSRIPDLLWENRYGQKIDKRNKPKGLQYSLATLIMWAALPVLWWSLYSLQIAD